MKNLHANATEPTAGRSGSALQSFIGALFLTLILSVFAPHGLAEPIAQLNESGHRQPRPNTPRAIANRLRHMP